VDFHHRVIAHAGQTRTKSAVAKRLLIFCSRILPHQVAIHFLFYPFSYFLSFSDCFRTLQSLNYEAVGIDVLLTVLKEWYFEKGEKNGDTLYMLYHNLIVIYGVKSESNRV
jgi:hypothetical protein